ncbi:MAG: hypothetical protein Q4D64_09605 [Prevotellaceae bacterium]|nr:hypothetical protein [Prevotellaceae bacterium]
MEQLGRSNFALISALYESKDGGLYSDIYFPIMKYVIVKLYCECTQSEYYGTSELVHSKIMELFGIKIPHVVIAKTVLKLAGQKNSNIQMTQYEDGKQFLITSAYFDEDENSYLEREKKFNEHMYEIEENYSSFVIREGIVDGDATFIGFITQNTENILGYFENETEEQVEEKYTSMVFFLEYLHERNAELYKMANQLFWSSVIVAFLQSERPMVREYSRGNESEYFLDTPIVMGLLDLSTEENYHSANDVFDIIRNSGGKVMVHPATMEEIKTILASVAQNKPIPGTSIYSAYMRKNMDSSDVMKIQLNLQREIEQKGMVVFPQAPADLRNVIMTKYKGKAVLKDLANTRNGASEYTSAYNIDQYREVHDIYMDDYVKKRRDETGKKNIYFLTTNSDLIRFCKQRHDGASCMLSTGKVILDLWMHNAEPAKVSSSVLTETMARCLDMHRSKVRTKLHEVARFFNKHKEDVAPEVYKEFLRLLYRRAKKVVEVADNLPQDDAKAAMTMLQEAIKEDNTYFEAINSEEHNRNIALKDEVEEKKRKVEELTEESEQKSQHIGSLKTKTEGLTADKEQLTSDLHERENELRMERERKKEEKRARLIAEKKNELYVKKEELERKLENLRNELNPWKEKRLQSFKNKELLTVFIPFVITTIIISVFHLAWKEDYRSFEDSPYCYWTIALIFFAVLTFSTIYSTEKRREARREKAYKAWEAKPENAEYGRLLDKIKEVKEEITTCKNLLEHSDEWMLEILHES